MAHRKILLAITTLVLTTAAAPSAPSHAIVARDAPCDAYSETCRPVIQANACFAQFVRVGTKEDVLQCVDDQDEARAEELVRTFFVFIP